MYSENKRSNWWYLVPIFIGLIGGIIAYFALRHDDPQKAKKCLLVGIIFLLIQGISELLKSYWASKKGEWPGESK